MKIYNNLIELEEKESINQNKILDYDDNSNDYHIEMSSKTPCKNQNQEINHNKNYQDKHNKEIKEEDIEYMNSFMEKVYKERINNEDSIDEEDEDNMNMIEDFIKANGKKSKIKIKNLFNSNLFLFIFYFILFYLFLPYNII